MRQKIKILVAAVGMLLFILAAPCKTEAAVKDILVFTQTWNTVDVMVGDTGYLRPQTENLKDPLGQPVQIASWVYSSHDPSVVAVDGDGCYQALQMGSSEVSIRGYSSSGMLLFYATCTIQVSVDMSGVTLAKNNLTGYLCGESQFLENIPILSSTVLNEENSEFTYSSTNPDMSVGCSLKDNVLIIESGSEGKTVLRVTINGKVFEIPITITRLEISKRSYVGSKGKTFRLSIKGTREKVVWRSSNPKVVKTAGSGTVRMRKNGNAVITAEVAGHKLGCAVSVISPKLLRVVKRAKYIGENWKYSQPKRMQNGYYDCSALVWKSYSRMGKKLGMANYAPVAADLAKWCKKHGKVLTKSYTRQHIQKMKFRPGDLMFETGQDNGRYKGIYHVEMFVGYAVAYYDAKGKPVLNELWAARPEGCYGGGHLMERP